MATDFSFSATPRDGSDLRVDGAVRRVDAADLLAGRQEIALVHQGAVYRLRLTRQNKLILTK